MISSAVSALDMRLIHRFAYKGCRALLFLSTLRIKIERNGTLLGDNNIHIRMATICVMIGLVVFCILHHCLGDRLSAELHPNRNL